MKAFILAAGNGTRLSPLTDTVPKCLLPIQGKPLLKIWLENCARAGINRVLINIHSHAQQVRQFVVKHRNGVDIQISAEKELLGSAGTLSANYDFVRNAEAFFVFYGDVLTNINLGEMLTFHLRKKKLATLAVHQVPDPQRCGIVTADQDGTIHNFEEKPAHPGGNWAFAGVMVARPEIIESVPHHRPADIGFHLLPRLAGEMAAYRFSGYLLDIGTPANYSAAQITWPGLQHENRRLGGR
jgi:mannose-1-phosphate guanylyltransferase